MHCVCAGCRCWRCMSRLNECRAASPCAHATAAICCAQRARDRRGGGRGNAAVTRRPDPLPAVGVIPEPRQLWRAALASRSVRHGRCCKAPGPDWMRRAANRKRSHWRHAGPARFSATGLWPPVHFRCHGNGRQVRTRQLRPKCFAVRARRGGLVCTMLLRAARIVATKMHMDPTDHSSNGQLLRALRLLSAHKRPVAPRRILFVVCHAVLPCWHVCAGFAKS